LRDSGEKFDAVSVAQLLSESGLLTKAGGTRHLQELLNSATNPTEAGSHALAIHRSWLARFDSAEVRTPKRIGEALRSYVGGVTERALAGQLSTGLLTGFDRIDARLCGIQAGDLVVVAARPGMGKSAFVSNIAVNVASPTEAVKPAGEPQAEAGHGVLLFCPWTSAEAMIARMASAESRLDLSKLRSGQMPARDWKKLTEVSEYLVALPLWIDDTVSLDIVQIRAKIHRLRRKVLGKWQACPPGRELELVIIDYLQLLKSADDASNREEGLGLLSRQLKALARELDVAVIVVSTLNRSPEVSTRRDRRPQLADLRGSGTIEDEADVVLFLYRDDYYFPDTSDVPGIAEVIVAKQRNGWTGKLRLHFSASCVRFDNLDSEELSHKQDT
jgi:replicative DNA helicase